MTTKQQEYDYLEMGDPLSSSSSSASGLTSRKSWLAAIGTALFLAGVSIGYASEAHGIWDWATFWKHKSDNAMLQAVPPSSKAMVALDDNLASTQDDLLADQTLTISGNKVTITFPSGALKDGRIIIAIVSVAPSCRANPPASVTIASTSIRFGQTTFHFNANDPSTLDQRVACRTVTGSVPGKTGTTVSVPITFTYPSEPKPQTQPVQRELISSSRCSATGDPHLTTFDGVKYDFQAPGVFRYVETRNFQVQVFQEKCPPSRQKQPNAPSCYRAFSLAFADSVVRFYLENNTIQIAKGSDDLKWFDIYRFGGNTEGFRVFLAADHTSYVDVTMGVWVQNYGYMNIVVQASPFLQDESMTGLMGNWNDNPIDDVRDEALLVAAHGLPMGDNLFTCTTDDCAKFLKAATNDDEVASTMPVIAPKLRQGMTQVNTADVPVRTYTPVLNKVMAMAYDLEAAEEPQEDVTVRALALCNSVISSVATCDKYVPDKSFFIYNVCLEDAVLVNDLTVVENTKIAYLRECRRELEEQILGAIGNATLLSTLNADRAALEFGDLQHCPGDCNGRGDCLAAGCHCEQGWTGLACDVQV